MAESEEDDGFGPFVPAGPGGMDWASHEAELLVEAQLNQLRAEVDEYEKTQREDLMVAESAPAETECEVSSAGDLVVSDRILTAVAMCYSSGSRQKPKFPWESGAMLSVFGRGRLLPRLQLAMVVPPAPGKPMVKKAVASEYASLGLATAPRRRRTPLVAKSSLKLNLKVVNRTDPRVRALVAFAEIMAGDPSSFRETRLLLAAGDLGLGGLHKHLDEVLCRKATGTLRKRAGSLKKFEAWLADRGKILWPLTESVVYDYASCEEVSGKATTLKSLLEAFGFLAHVLGWDTEDTLQVLRSGRLRGLAGKYELAGGLVKQATPLTAKMICALEEELFYGDNDNYRMVAGGALAMLFARSRCGDAQNSTAILCDFAPDGSGFIELQSADVKTATSVAKRRRLLPMVAPSKGLLGHSWAGVWMELRGKMNLSLAEGYPVLPDLGPDGPLKAAMPSQRVGAWVRELLMQRGFSEVEVAGITSHSLKCTLLSWASKIALPNDTRRFLGHHTKAEDGSLLTYGRDNAAGPMRALEGVLQAVRSGAFLPDCTRSGRFAEKEARIALSEQHEGVLGAKPAAGSASVPMASAADGGVVDPSCSGSDSDSSSTEDEQDVVLAVAADAGTPADTLSGFCLHALIGTVHRLAAGSASKFICGRLMHNAHVALDDAADLTSYHRCTDCRF